MSLNPFSNLSPGKVVMSIVGWLLVAVAVSLAVLAAEALFFARNVH